jgi:hypothetical protein
MGLPEEAVIDEFAAPEPVYTSWTDYLSRTSYGQRMKRCNGASKRANRTHVCFWTKKFKPNDAHNAHLISLIQGPCVLCGALPHTQCLDTHRLTSKAVWGIVEEAKGRCMYCHSLAVENRPSKPHNGAATPWGHIGRRIGSLEHIEWFIDGRKNQLSNLRWACLWCNVHPDQRIPYSNGNGGFYPIGD